MNLNVLLGIHPTREGLRSTVLIHGRNNDRWMYDLWPRITIVTDPEPLDLVAPTIQELDLVGRDWQAAREHVLNTQLGWDCPPEVGPLLALSKRTDEELVILMQPLRGLNNCPYTLSIRGGQLTAYHTVRGRPLSSTTRIVYATRHIRIPVEEALPGKTFGMSGGCCI